MAAYNAAKAAMAAFTMSTQLEISGSNIHLIDLQPADIMNTRRGHVLMFVKWLDEEKKRALFYESAPFSKTRASERDVNEMVADGFVPLRYRHMR